MSKKCLENLELYSWPGNIRQLENVIERLVILNGNKTIDWSDLPTLIKESKNEFTINESFDEW